MPPPCDHLEAAMQVWQMQRQLRTVNYELRGGQHPTKQHHCRGRNVVVAPSRVCEHFLDVHTGWTGSVLSRVAARVKGLFANPG